MPDVAALFPCPGSGDGDRQAVCCSTCSCRSLARIGLQRCLHSGGGVDSFVVRAVQTAAVDELLNGQLAMPFAERSDSRRSVRRKDAERAHGPHVAGAPQAVEGVVDALLGRLEPQRVCLEWAVRAHCCAGSARRCGDGDRSVTMSRVRRRALGRSPQSGRRPAAWRRCWRRCCGWSSR